MEFIHKIIILNFIRVGNEGNLNNPKFHRSNDLPRDNGIEYVVVVLCTIPKTCTSLPRYYHLIYQEEDGV